MKKQIAGRERAYGRRGGEVRDARPEHFHRAVEHGFSLALSGAPTALLGTMARGCAARGLTDAAAGYDHARLRLTTALREVRDGAQGSRVAITAAREPAEKGAC